jgi:hypothetical protein
MAPARSRWPAPLFEVAVAQNLASNYNFRESRMHSLLTSIVLCLFAQTAVAQCVATAATPAVAQVRQAGELIKTAAAGTHGEPTIRNVSAPAAARAGGADGDEQPRRTGPAMVLVAVAVMSAIALRRGASGQ